ncbi:MAG TPA: hypothetical protein VFK06_05910, partial [Candidatus Angelobacter sp.]|nr:hypothetical protein [Candidatus Angelobacter sp.]
GFAHLASLTKDFAQVVFGSVERQVAEVEFVIGHFILSFVSGSSHWLTPVVGLKSPLETAARTAEETQLATYHAPLKGSSKTALAAWGVFHDSMLSHGFRRQVRDAGE